MADTVFPDVDGILSDVGLEAEETWALLDGLTDEDEDEDGWFWRDFLCLGSSPGCARPIRLVGRVRSDGVGKAGWGHIRKNSICHNSYKLL